MRSYLCSRVRRAVNVVQVLPQDLLLDVVQQPHPQQQLVVVPEQHYVQLATEQHVCNINSDSLT